MCRPKLPNYAIPSLFPPGNRKFVLKSVTLFLFKQCLHFPQQKGLRLIASNLMRGAHFKEMEQKKMKLSNTHNPSHLICDSL